MRLPVKLLEGLFRVAFAEARTGVRLGHGGPFGAAVVDAKGRLVSRAHNTVLRDDDPTCHAEVNAIRKAAKLRRSPHLRGCTLIASSEPCPMCLATAYWADVAGIVYCVPKEVAARAGFGDAFIYEELRKAPSRRRMSQRPFGALLGEGKAVFDEWKKGNGELY